MLGYDAGSEVARLAALERYAVLDSAPEEVFDSIVRTAAHLFDVSLAVITLVDDRRAWVKAAIGTDFAEAPREGSFSDLVIRTGGVLVVPDAYADPDDTVRNSPVVVGEPFVRMLAGAPLLTADGHAVGALCVGDQTPRALSTAERQTLSALAQLVMARLEVKECAARQREAEDALAATARRFDALVEDVSDIVAVIDADGRVSYVSEALVRLLGHTDVTAAGFDIFEHVHPDHSSLARAALALAVTAPGRAGPVELRVATADGSWRWLEVMTNNLLADPAVKGVVVTVRDVTDRRRTEALLSAEAHVLGLLTGGAALEEILGFVVELLEEHAGPGRYSIRVTDEATGRLVRGASPSLPTEFVAALDPVTVADCAVPLSAAAGARTPFVWADLLNDPSCDPRFARLAARNGVRSAWAAPIISRPTGRILGALAGYGSEPGEPTDGQLLLTQMAADTAALAIERRHLDQEMARQATSDALTGLPNRAGIIDQLDTALTNLALHRSYRDRLAVLMIDLDRFKVVNDRFGHEAGDAVIVAVADRLREAVRPGDLIGRFGADEFVVVCSGLVGELESVGVAEALMTALAAPLAPGDVMLTASVGIAVADRTGATAENLLRDADTAMYRAKERGAARCEVFTEATRRRALLRATTERELRRALERGELQVWYQPAVRLPDGAVTGFEALVRWQHPERGLVMPAEFIPVAEDSGLIVALGEWVLRQACAHAREWQLVHPCSELTMAVNLSARQMAEPNLVAVVASALHDSGLAPEALCLEITESTVMEDAEAAVVTLQALKDLGVTIAIDDFGTGYSSLSYLSTLPVDVLKVDRTFVSGLGQGSNRAIVGAVIAMADALGLSTVAEGVETRQQIDELVRLDCRAAQGFFFGRPEPASGGRLVG